jgi:ribose 5-phosphate isomerase A
MSSRIPTAEDWGRPLSNREQKEAVAARLAALVQDGQTIGFGSGSTSWLTALAIGRRVRDEGIRCCAVPTSIEISLVCAELGIPVVPLGLAQPEWCFDGADEVNPLNWLIKGRGGAMFKEKIVFRSARKRYVVVDASKRVEKLGSHFAVPIEVFPAALPLVKSGLVALGATELELRAGEGKDGPTITEAGNLILDARFPIIEEGHERAIKSITGVVESGLFIGDDIEVISP